MTAGQITKAAKLIGKKTRHEICKDLGISLASLKRAFRGTRFPQPYAYSEETVNKVCAYYEKYGKNRTEKKFPDVKLRSIVERNYDKFSPRQVRWTGKQIIELAKMAGLISYTAQAKYFNRPRANEVSIWSYWVKKGKLPSGNLNGMSLNKSKHLVEKNCPVVKCKLLKRRDSKAPLGSYSERNITLWVDMENHLKPGLPKFLKDGIKAMAKYQKWLFKSERPKIKILNMIKEREMYECKENRINITYRGCRSSK